MENGLSRTAWTLGLIAVISAILFTIYIPVILGALAIVLAIVARGKEGFCRKARSAVAMGIVAIVLNITVVSYSFYTAMNNPIIHTQLNDICAQNYGHTFDEIVDDMKDGVLDLEYKGFEY